MNRLLLIFCLYFFMSFLKVNGQEGVIKHRVASGETITQIGIKYNVSTSAILNLNPNAFKRIKVNDIILIPELRKANSFISKNNLTEEKVITHVVKPGETKFSLSKLYSVSIRELEGQNPEIIKGLQAGHILSILIKEYKGIKHVVLPKENFYSISRKYGVHVRDLIAVNDLSSENILLVGAILNIPSNNVDNVNFYLVKKGDTKYGISLKYGMTISKLESMNPSILPILIAGQRIKLVENESDLNFQGDINQVEEKSNFKSNPVIPILSKRNEVVLKVKDTAKNGSSVRKLASEYKGRLISYEIMPKETFHSLLKKTSLTKDQLINLNPQLVNGLQSGMIVQIPAPIRNEELISLEATVVKGLKREVVFLMPFTLEEYNSNLNKYVGKTDSFYASSNNFLEGGLKALDSIKTLGLDVSFKVIKIEPGSKKNDIISQLKKNNVSGFNLIFMPNYVNELAIVSEFLAGKNVSIVSDVQNIYKNKFKNILFTIPSSQFEIEKMLDYLSEKQENIIVVSQKNRLDNQKIVKNRYPNIKIIQDLSNQGIEKHLDKSKLNYVVLDCDKSSLLVGLTNELIKLLNDYKIQLALFQTSSITSLEDLSSNRLALFELIYPSFSNKELSLSENQMFFSEFKNKNLTFHQGFDITYDMLLRSFQGGSVENTFQLEGTEYTNLKFKYLKTKRGFSNQTFFIHKFK